MVCFFRRLLSPSGLWLRVTESIAIEKLGVSCDLVTPRLEAGNTISSSKVTALKDEVESANVREEDQYLKPLRRSRLEHFASPLSRDKLR